MDVLNTIIDKIEEILISVMLGMATLLVFSQVIARYVFKSGINWAPEMVEYLFLWSVMIGASYGVKHKVHLGVDVLVKKLPPSLRRLASLLSIIISIGFTGGMTYLSYFYVMTAKNHDLISVDLQVPLWIPHLALPIGFLFITLRFVQVGWLVYKGEMETITKSGEPVTETDK